MENVEESASASTSAEVVGRGFRNKRRQVDPTLCPICSCTLRSTEIEQHLNCEIDKLKRINGKVPNGKCKATSPTNSNEENNIDQQWETFQKVRTNRQCRQKTKTKKRKIDENSVLCPVCNKHTNEEINMHVEKCLRLHNGEEAESDENIDVEGFDEYEWAGQSRIRATSLLQGGVSSLGTSIQSTNEDEDLVVDGDDAQIYGEPQYSERDIILPDSDRERDALRKAVIGTDVTKRLEDGENSVDEKASPAGDPVVEALKSRIKELEKNKQEIYKCLICMERYQTPVISVCCWHVHCENCWLQTLGSKKLCPQCNMITSPADLRRIYM